MSHWPECSACDSVHSGASGPDSCQLKHLHPFFFLSLLSFIVFLSFSPLTLVFLPLYLASSFPYILTYQSHPFPRFLPWLLLCFVLPPKFLVSFSFHPIFLISLLPSSYLFSWTHKYFLLLISGWVMHAGPQLWALLWPHTYSPISTHTFWQSRAEDLYNLNEPDSRPTDPNLDKWCSIVCW